MMGYVQLPMGFAQQPMMGYNTMMGMGYNPMMGMGYTPAVSTRDDSALNAMLQKIVSEMEEMKKNLQGKIAP